MPRRAPVRLGLPTLICLLLIACATAAETGDESPDAERPAVVPALPPVPDEPLARRLSYPRLLDDPEHAGRIAAVSSTKPPRPRTDAEIEAYLESLTLRQRIGQRFIAPVPGTRIADGAGSVILDVAPAGFILYPWNYRSAEDVRRLTGSLQFVASYATPGISLLLCADQEGGRVSAFRFADFIGLPSAAELARFGDPSLIRSAAYITARQLGELGINMNLAPVLDLYGTADDTIIGDRSFGDDPQVVSRFVRPYLDAYRESGLIATAKHFPGHGVTTVDSHHALPVVSTTRTDLADRDLVPFREAIDAGVPAIMTGHLLFDRIDPFYPVTISRVFLHDLLRHELGFEGVVVTDGLEMEAMRSNYSLPQTLVRLFKFDVDLILLYRDYRVGEVVDMVEDLIAAGLLTEDDVNRGVRRVLAMKREYGLLGSRR